MQLCVRLEGVMQRNQKRTVPNGLQNLSLRLRMLGRLLLLHDRRFLQDFHGVEPAGVGARSLTHQEHFSVSCAKGFRFVSLYHDLIR